MIVKTYRAPTMPDAIKKIKEDLGEDAVILSYKKVKQGSFFSFFKKEVYEVTAAIDEKPPKQEKNFKNVVKKYTGSDIPTKKENEADKLEERIKKLEQLILSAGKESIEKLVGDIKNDINDLKTAINYVKKTEEVDISKIPLGMNKYFTYMCDLGIKKKYAYKIALGLYRNINKSKLNDEEYVKEYLSIVISQFFKQSKPKKKNIVLLGPTGVGKTTTLAKLAAIYKLKQDKKVGIITTDTYRIGAVDQLLNYAKIMDIPAIVSITKEDFKNALEELKDMNVVLVDTVGRSPQDIKRLNELFGIFKNEDRLHLSLVMAVNTKEEDCLNIHKRFGILPIDDLIFTKVDETKTPGSMLNLVVKLKKPVSYVSFGQDVPDDIMEAQPLKISSLIIKGEVKNG
ncbi:flagellar biosynthesis protein FlhF [Hippea maritima]|uniref:Flagellar biosynthesis protein FlhF n=1 Tax=Hippea maritima (strain ATCC 700847 / DSM 10411 / MH2) TaxID=760142 RepID=F2LUW7_HIPMA|nr:flagellar biosynthesis protein FlhF [Hippea maritima]AEA33572.1 flagellar biosynthetic protein FlhF [Hippea maritima DSM 10411]